MLFPLKLFIFCQEFCSALFALLIIKIKPAGKILKGNLP